MLIKTMKLYKLTILLIIVTEFWKITLMGAREIIRISQVWWVVT